jgi:hypothetical protein
VVLHRLERADGFAELLALLRVLDRCVEHALCAAHHFRARGRRAERLDRLAGDAGQRRAGTRDFYPVLRFQADHLDLFVLDVRRGYQGHQRRAGDHEARRVGRVRDQRRGIRDIREHLARRDLRTQ